MNRIFSNCVDAIALSGSDGIPFSNVINPVLGPNPDSALVAWIIAQLRIRPTLFTSPDFDAAPDKLHVTACESLQNRALGFNGLENSNVMPQSRQILGAIGRAGASGVLQSDLADLLKISPTVVHHYLIALFSNGLIARKRVVLTRKKKSVPCPTSTRQDSVEDFLKSHSAPNHEVETAKGNEDASKEADDSSAILVTYTSVLVLARYQTLLETSNHPNAFSSRKDKSTTSPVVAAGNSTRLPNDMPAAGQNISSSVSVFDLANDAPLRRIIETLRCSRVRAERDLKFICFPESDKDPDTSMEVFRYTRHRKFRIIRNRLNRLGIVKEVRRKCHDASGKFLGELRCLALTRRAREEDFIEETLRDLNHSISVGKPTLLSQDENRPRASSCIPQKLHPLLVGYNGPAYEAEIDAIQQVYALIERSGAQGISVPEIDAYLDGGTGLTGLAQKRIRNFIKAISRKVDIVERQLFEGKIMFIRFALKRFVSNADGWHKTGDQTDQIVNAASNQLTPVGKRKKVGLTTLGEERQKIVLDLLKQRTVIAQEVLGREIAEIEGNQVVRIDRKVMVRIINDLIEKKLVKVITATKPCIKGVKKWDTVRLLTLPHVQETSREVRNFISSALDRLLHGHAVENNISNDGGKNVNGSEGSANDADDHRSRKDGDDDIPGRARCGTDHGFDSEKRRNDGNPNTSSTGLKAPSRTMECIRGGSERSSGDACRKTRIPVNFDDGSDGDDESADGVDADERVDGMESDDENEIVVVKYVGEGLRKESLCQHPGTGVFSEADSGKNNNSDNLHCQLLQNDKFSTLKASKRPKLNREGLALCSGGNERLSDSSGSSAESGEGQLICGLQNSLESGGADGGRQTGKKRSRSILQNSPVTGQDDIGVQAPLQSPPNRRTVRVESDFRDSRKSRISRLQAIDYGWMKGSMARARLFHKLLFKYVSADSPNYEIGESNAGQATCADVSVPLSEVSKFPTNGKFTIFSCLRDMTVEEYSAAVGICNNYGNLISTIKKYRMRDVMDLIKGELNSAYAARRIKCLIHILSKIGLIKPKDGSLWTLSGAGAIRDFGRGLPPGVEPYAIPFTSRSRVDMYWRELRKFSQFRLLSSGTKSAGTREASMGSRGYELRDIYAVPAWDTGMLHEFSLYEQLIFECILQRLCGVDVSPTLLDLSGPNIICSPLRGFSVEEIIDELDYVASLNPYISKHRGNANISEGLLGYARMRITEEIPKIVRQPEEGFSRQLRKFSRFKDIPASHKVPVLRVKRTVRGMRGEEIAKEVTDATKMKQMMHGKALVRKRLKVDESPVAEVPISESISMLKEILRFGSIAHCTGDSGLPDWRRVVAQWLEKKCSSQNRDVALSQNQCRAVTALCHCLLVRMGFDVLSLQLTLRAQKLSIEENGNSLKSLDMEKVEALIDREIGVWRTLGDIICGLITEVLSEVEHEWRIVVDFQRSNDSSGGKSVPPSHKKMLEDYFSSRYRTLPAHQSLSNLLSVTSARCRRLANLRVKEKMHFGVLLGMDQENEDGFNDLGVYPQEREGSTAREPTAAKSWTRRTAFSNDNASEISDSVENTLILNESMSVARKACANSKKATRSEGLVENPVRVELAEIIVHAVLRQNRNEQWSANSKKLLERFDVESISLARDRLLLGEVIVILEEHDKNRKHLSIVKGERGPDPLVFLTEVNGEALETNWIEDLVRVRSEDGSCGVDIAETEIYENTRSLTPASTFAASLMTHLAVFGNKAYTFDMGPFFVGDEPDNNQCIVKLDCRKMTLQNDESGGPNSVGTSPKPRGADMSKVEELSHFITELLDRSGWHGVMMHDLLKQAEEHGYDVIGEGDVFIQALDDMVRKNDLYRFAVETESKEWNVNDGGLFLSPLHGRMIESTHGLVTAWTDVTGQADVALVREAATAILETVMKRPGIDIAGTVAEVFGRFPGVPRRAHADLTFGLIRDGFIRVDLIAKIGTSWVDIDHPEPILNLDEVCIIAWKRHVKVTLKPISERIQGGKTWVGPDQHMTELVMAYMNSAPRLPCEI